MEGVRRYACVAAGTTSRCFDKVVLRKVNPIVAKMLEHPAKMCRLGLHADQSAQQTTRRRTIGPTQRRQSLSMIAADQIPPSESQLFVDWNVLRDGRIYVKRSHRYSRSARKSLCATRAISSSEKKISMLVARMNSPRARRIPTFLAIIWKSGSTRPKWIKTCRSYATVITGQSTQAF
jgi:hypothetical protein